MLQSSSTLMKHVTTYYTSTRWGYVGSYQKNCKKLFEIFEKVVKLITPHCICERKSSLSLWVQYWRRPGGCQRLWRSLQCTEISQHVQFVPGQRSCTLPVLSSGPSLTVTLAPGKLPQEELPEVGLHKT